MEVEMNKPFYAIQTLDGKFVRYDTKRAPESDTSSDDDEALQLQINELKYKAEVNRMRCHKHELWQTKAVSSVIAGIGCFLMCSWFDK